MQRTAKAISHNPVVLGLHSRLFPDSQAVRVFAMHHFDMMPSPKLMHETVPVQTWHPRQNGMEDKMWSPCKSAWAINPVVSLDSRRPTSIAVRDSP